MQSFYFGHQPFMLGPKLKCKVFKIFLSMFTQALVRMCDSMNLCAGISLESVCPSLGPNEAFGSVLSKLKSNLLIDYEASIARSNQYRRKFLQKLNSVQLYLLSFHCKAQFCQPRSKKDLKKKDKFTPLLYAHFLECCCVNASHMIQTPLGKSEDIPISNSVSVLSDQNKNKEVEKHQQISISIFQATREKLTICRYH